MPFQQKRELVKVSASAETRAGEDSWRNENSGSLSFDETFRLMLELPSSW